jgi:hypothetical protein
MAPYSSCAQSECFHHELAFSGPLHFDLDSVSRDLALLRRQVQQCHIFQQVFSFHPRLTAWLGSFQVSVYKREIEEAVRKVIGIIYTITNHL